jgi:hypothetical protein
MVTSAVTPAPLNPVPATVTLVPTGPCLVDGEVIATFCSTVKVAVAVLTPSETIIVCAPAVAAGIAIANVASPPVEAVTVDGAVVTTAPSNLAVRIVLGAKSVAVIVTEVPTAPVLVLRAMPSAANAGAAAIATRLHTIASTTSSFIIFGNFIII